MGSGSLFKSSMACMAEAMAPDHLLGMGLEYLISMTSIGLGAQLPHSYYFTTPILVLKFMNKGVFFEEIQDSHCPRKRGYFFTHLCEFEEKVFYCENGGSFWLKSQCFTTKKGVHIGLKS